MTTLFEHAGGLEALHRLEEAFYASVLKDPLLQPLFGAGQPRHVDHLTAFTAESFGGPDRFTGEGGEQEDDVTLLLLQRLPALPVVESRQKRVPD